MIEEESYMNDCSFFIIIIIKHVLQLASHESV